MADRPGVSPEPAGSRTGSGVHDATLALVRHGQTTWVAEGRFQGSADPPLSELGERQAAAVARRLAGPFDATALPLPAGPPRGIWHSPLTRAAATAGAIRAAREVAVPMVADQGLVELAQGDWEGRTSAEVLQRWPDALAAWRADPTNNHAPGGEALQVGAARAVGAVDRILSALGTGLRETWTGDIATRSPVQGYADAIAGVSGAATDAPHEPWGLIVAHDGILRLVLLHLLGVSLDHYWSMPFGLCSITVVELRAGRARLRAHNLADHLPA